MPEVVQPRRERRFGADAGVPAQTAERCLGGGVVEPRAAQRDEEAGRARVRAEPVPDVGVPLECLEGAVVDG